MLDKLIAMLPGVELKKDGVITVNGRRVDRLLVNGEDFFTGSPKVALENLPAYTVDEVKVYERMNDRDRPPVRPALHAAVAHRHVCQHQRLHGRLFL